MSSCTEQKHHKTTTWDKLLCWFGWHGPNAPFIGYWSPRQDRVTYMIRKCVHCDQHWQAERVAGFYIFEHPAGFKKIPKPDNIS